MGLCLFRFWVGSGSGGGGSGRWIGGRYISYRALLRATTTTISALIPRCSLRVSAAYNEPMLAQLLIALHGAQVPAQISLKPIHET